MAMALARAGIEPVIYEARSGSADDLGSFLNLASNGIEALRVLDVPDQVLTDGFPTPRMILWSGRGKPRCGSRGHGIGPSAGPPNRDDGRTPGYRGGRHRSRPRTDP